MNAPEPSKACSEATKAAQDSVPVLLTTGGSVPALHDVLRCLPPDIVRRNLWLPLSRHERASLRLVCRELRDVASRACVQDLVLVASLPQRTARGAQPQPWRPRRALHDTFSGARSVTFLLQCNGTVDGRGGIGASAGCGVSGSGATGSVGGAVPAANAARLGMQGNTAQVPLPVEECLLQHLNTFRAPAACAPAPAAASVPVPAPGAVHGACGTSSGHAVSTSAEWGEYGHAAPTLPVAPPAGSSGAMGPPSFWELLTSAVGPGLGVCRSVREVRLLGLPYDLLHHSPCTLQLAKAYPCLEALVLRCTQPPLPSHVAMWQPGSSAAEAVPLAQPPQPLQQAPMPQMLQPQLAQTTKPATGQAQAAAAGASPAAGFSASRLPALPWSDSLWSTAAVGTGSDGATSSWGLGTGGGTTAGSSGSAQHNWQPVQPGPQTSWAQEGSSASAVPPPLPGAAGAAAAMASVASPGTVGAMAGLVLTGEPHRSEAGGPAATGAADAAAVGAEQLLRSGAKHGGVKAAPPSLASPASRQPNSPLLPFQYLHKLTVHIPATPTEGTGADPFRIAASDDSSVMAAAPAQRLQLTLASLLAAPQLPSSLVSLRLGGVVFSEPIAAAVAQLTSLTELRLRLLLPSASQPPPPSASVSQQHVPSPVMAPLPGRLALLTRLRVLSLDLYGSGPGRWLGAAAVGAAELEAALAAAAPPSNAEAAAAGGEPPAAVGADAGGVAAGVGGTGRSGGGGGGGGGGARPPVALLTWADWVERCGSCLTRLEFPQILLDAPLVQALRRCPGLTRLSALGLASSRATSKVQHRGASAGASGMGGASSSAAAAAEEPLGRLTSLRLANVRLGRNLLDFLNMAPNVRHLALGLNAERYQLRGSDHNQRVAEAGPQYDKGDAADGAGAGAADGAGTGAGLAGSGQAQAAPDLPPGFVAAYADGQALASSFASSSSASSSKDGRRAESRRGGGRDVSSLAGGGGGGGAGGAWSDLLRVCWRCEEVELAVAGALEWPVLVGWLSGALGRRLTTLGMQGQVSSWQWQVQDDALEAVVTGLPHLRRLELLSYDVSRQGLLELAALRELTCLRFDMQGFCAWFPAEYILDLAVEVARIRQQRCHNIGSSVGGSRATGGDGGSSGVGAQQPLPYEPPPLPPPPPAPPPLGLRVAATFLTERHAADVKTQLLNALGDHGGSGRNRTYDGDAASCGSGSKWPVRILAAVDEALEEECEWESAA